MFKLLILRSLASVSSLCLLLFLAKTANPEFSDLVYTDIALLAANAILLTFGFEKKTWSAKTTEQGINVYNVWFQFICCFFIPFLLYSIWAEKFLIGFSSIILSFIFMISWELQSGNKKNISTVLFTMSLPFSYFLSLLIVYCFKLDQDLYRYFIPAILCVILIYALSKSKILKSNHKFITIDLSNFFREIKENSLLVIPAYLTAYTIFLLLNKSSIQLPGTAFEYSGLIRIMAGVSVISFAINRYTINSVKKDNWTKLFKNVPYLILFSFFYGIGIFLFSDYIYQILTIKISSILIVSLILLNIIIAYILTQLVFWSVSKKLFKEVAISSTLGSLVLIILLNIFVIDLLMLVLLILLGNIIRLFVILFLIKK